MSKFTVTILVLLCGCSVKIPCKGEQDFIQVLTAAKYAKSVCFDINVPESLVGTYCMEKKK